MFFHLTIRRIVCSVFSDVVFCLDFDPFFLFFFSPIPLLGVCYLFISGLVLDLVLHISRPCPSKLKKRNLRVSLVPIGFGSTCLRGSQNQIIFCNWHKMFKHVGRKNNLILKKINYKNSEN